MPRAGCHRDKLPKREGTARPNELRISRREREYHVLKSPESRARSGRLHARVSPLWSSELIEFRVAQLRCFASLRHRFSLRHHVLAEDSRRQLRKLEECSKHRFSCVYESIHFGTANIAFKTAAYMLSHTFTNQTLTDASRTLK
jgi:hypothetical protein